MAKDVDGQFFLHFFDTQLAELPSVLQSWAILFFIRFLGNLVLARQSCSRWAILFLLGNLVGFPTKILQIQSFDDDDVTKLSSLSVKIG